MLRVNAAKMEACRVCQRPLGDAATTTAVTLGRHRFLVHTEPCARVVGESAAAVGKLAMTGLQSFLQKKSPLALTAVRLVARVLTKPKDLPG